VPVREGDAQELSTLLNEIIARGGTIAWEDPFEPELLARIMLTGPDVICCFVAAELAIDRIAWLPVTPDVRGFARRRCRHNHFCARRPNTTRSGLRPFRSHARGSWEKELCSYQRYYPRGQYRRSYLLQSAGLCRSQCQARSASQRRYLCGSCQQTLFFEIQYLTLGNLIFPVNDVIGTVQPLGAPRKRAANFVSTT
jgi:hypothetical protein